ncbi:MAG: DNA-processing protein DprA [Puniceicoccales bacterium]|jgi:DNA processing protein|nr:DNA-processing protein DprA [Puniceicoccales bacterium]
MKLAGLTNTQLLMILSSLPTIGSITFFKLYNNFKKNLHQIFSATKEELMEIGLVSEAIANKILNWEKFFDLGKTETKLAKIRGDFIGYCDNENYPKSLKNIHDPPIGLYSIGNGSLLNSRCIAIVGTRKPTLYGIKVATEFAINLANLGFCIVSGLAQGIDSSAHEGAIAAGGKTIAVLGCGIDIIYPSENRRLYKKIAEQGCIISEFPLEKRADKQTFPIRNRLISGLCDNVIIIETAKHGGSMITANIACEQGKNVFVIPGRIDQTSSEGCHELIRNGATLVTSVDDILEEINFPMQQALVFDDQKEEPKISDPVERQVLNFLKSCDNATIDDIMINSQLTLGPILKSIQLLEIKQLITKNFDGSFQANFMHMHK